MAQNKKKVTYTLSVKALDALEEMRGIVPRATFLESIILEKKARAEQQEKFERMMKNFFEKKPDLAEKLFTNGLDIVEDMSDDEIKQIMQG